MDDKILQSVIELTRQHDIDSLELTLITTLADIIPANAFFLVKPADETAAGEYVEVMRLSMSDGPGHEQKFSMSDKTSACTGSPQLQECFDKLQPVHYKAENGLDRFLFPIINNNRTVAALGVEKGGDLSSWRPMIEAFVKIYSNYLTILRISERDKLTDLHNRRTFDSKLEKLLRAQRQQYDTYADSSDTAEKRRKFPDAHSWLAMVDIDHFKRINDTFGHLFGDEVILIVAQQMKRFFRGSDLLFRFGGEEFVIILAPLPAEIARQLLDRFRLAIARHSIPQVGEITISIGYAQIIDGVSSHVTLDHADKALYHAKEHGRNCVYNYDELVESGSLGEHKKSSVTLFFDDDPPGAN